MRTHATPRNEPADSDRAAIPAAAEPARSPASRLWESLTGVLLFVAGAVFVLWQNSRLTVLWDLSYILENATRIALGQVPYRDFPFPYAPLTFVMQAAIIKLTGSVVLHHYLYAATASACATLLSWRIVLRMLHDSALPVRLTAGLLCAPLVFLGTSSILPNPFYDADCTLMILLCVWLLLHIEAGGWKPRSSVFCGAPLAVPLFVKQNTGLAFLLAMALCLGWLVIRNGARGGNKPVRVRISSWLVLAGAAAGVLFALALIHSICGLGNYYHWTVRFAASRRLPGLAAMLGIYRDPALLWAYASFGAGLAIFRITSKRAARWIAFALLSLPFLWTVAALLARDDDSDRAEALLHLWPVLLAASLVFALWRLPRAKTFADVVPIVLLGTIHGAFLSQQLWGSTYALWPLMIVLIAGIVAALAPRRAATGGREHSTAPLVAFTSVVCVTLLIAGGHYALSHERLSYADLSDEKLHHSSLAPLRGMAMRGDWLPDFEELVAYANREIPANDAILMLPGEDLFYYTTGRRPQFPVVMIDNTVNPYSAEEIAQLARERNVRWVVVKRNLQLQEEPVAFRPQLMQLLSRDYEEAESLNNYDVFRRKAE